jgi:hypothetical protein
MGEATARVPDRAKALFARHVLKPIDIDELGAVLLEVATRSRINIGTSGQSMSRAA